MLEVLDYILDEMVEGVVWCNSELDDDMCLRIVFSEKETIC